MSIVLTFTGAYQSIDDAVGVGMNKFLTEKGKKISQEYIPLYDKFDECLQKNNIPCIQQMYKKFHKLDQELTQNLKNPKIKAGYAKFTENMFKSGEQAVKGAKKTGKVNLEKLDQEHKKINDAFYKLMN